MAWNRVGKPNSFNTKEFFVQHYGQIAFNNNGTIKTSYINKALKELDKELEILTKEINSEQDHEEKFHKQNIFKNLNNIKKRIINAKNLKESVKERKREARAKKFMY